MSIYTQRKKIYAYATHCSVGESYVYIHIEKENSPLFRRTRRTFGLLRHRHQLYVSIHSLEGNLKKASPKSPKSPKSPESPNLASFGIGINSFSLLLLQHIGIGINSTSIHSLSSSFGTDWRLILAILHRHQAVVRGSGGDFTLQVPSAIPLSLSINETLPCLLDEEDQMKKRRED